MTYGIYAKNDSGFTQIDQTTQGFQVLATGTTAGGYGGTTVTIPSSFPDDILVVAKPHSPNLLYDYRLNASYSDRVINGTRTRTASMGFAFSTLVVFTGRADYAIIQRCSLFDDSVISGQTPANYGLNVYRSDGTLSFTTEHPTYRVQGARHTNISASNTGAGVWYNGVDSTDMQHIYALAMSYGQFRYKVFGPNNDRQFLSQSRLGQWNFATNTFGTAIQSNGGDVNSGTTLEDTVWAGHRTELIGYIV